MSSRFNITGVSPTGGLMTCLAQAVSALRDITEQEIPAFVAVIAKWPDVLFSSNPTWYFPLLHTTHGLTALSKLPADVLKDVFNSHNEATKLSTHMTLCLRLQHSFLSPGNAATDLKTVVAWCNNGILSIEQLYTTISHFIHPDQSYVLSQLAQQFSPHSQRSSPLYHQYNVQTDARAGLFPNLDTTQISPQYNWFLYVLSKYNPICKATYSDNLESYIKHHSETLLQGNLSISDIFIHNTLFNTYDEYLDVKLAQIQDHTDPATKLSDSSTLFSLFPNQHPLLPTASSREDYSQSIPTDQYKTFFVVSFLLGPSLLVQHSSTFYNDLNYEQFVGQFEGLAALPFADAPALAFQLIAHKYRVYLLTVDSWALFQRTHRPASQYLVNRRETPPVFTHAYFPLQFTMLSSSRIVDSPIGKFFSPTFIKESNVISNLMRNAPALTGLLYNIMAQCSVNHLDAHLVSTIQRLLVNQQEVDFRLQTWADPGISENRQQRDSFILILIQRSYELYICGRDTHYQYLFRELMFTAANNTLIYNHVNSILVLPFLLYPSHHILLQKHITLCVHAGLLNPLPINRAQVSQVTCLNALTRSLPTIHRELIPFRTLFHSYLVKLINFEVFFPPQSTTLMNLIPTLSIDCNFIPTQIPNASHIASTPLNDPCCCPLELLPNPLKSAPNVKSALLDSNGHVLAMQFAPQPQNTPSSSSNIIELFEVHPFPVDAFFSKQNDAFFDLNQHCSPCPNEARIRSAENQHTMQSQQTINLQREYKRYRQRRGEIEANLVAEQMKTVLTVADVAGLLDFNNKPPSTCLTSAKSYPFPPPIALSNDIASLDARKLSNWALELLIVISFNLQPFQPLKQSSLPGCAEFHSAVTTAPLSQEFIFNNRFLANRPTVISKAINSILSASPPLLSGMIQYSPYPPSSNHIIQIRESPILATQTKRGVLFDTLLESIMTISLKLLGSLESLSTPLSPKTEESISP